MVFKRILMNMFLDKLFVIIIVIIVIIMIIEFVSGVFLRFFKED